MFIQIYEDLHQWFLMVAIGIINDCSGRVWVYLLKHKDKALDRFKSWKILVKNQTDKRVKRLRLDNGLEYYNEKIYDY